MGMQSFRELVWRQYYSNKHLLIHFCKDFHAHCSGSKKQSWQCFIVVNERRWDTCNNICFSVASEYKWKSCYWRIERGIEYPKQSVSSLVSLLSLKGIWLLAKTNLLILLSFANAAIQFPNAAIDLLIFFVSSARIASGCDFDSRSLPARSTIVNVAFFICF